MLVIGTETALVFMDAGYIGGVVAARSTAKDRAASVFAGLMLGPPFLWVGSPPPSSGFPSPNTLSFGGFDALSPQKYLACLTSRQTLWGIVPLPSASIFLDGAFGNAGRIIYSPLRRVGARAFRAASRSPPRISFCDVTVPARRSSKESFCTNAQSVGPRNDLGYWAFPF